MLESAKKKQTLMNVKRTILCLQRQKCQRKGNYLIHFTSKIQMLIFSKEIREIYNDQQKALQVGKVIMFQRTVKACTCHWHFTNAI